MLEDQLRNLETEDSVKPPPPDYARKALAMERRLVQAELDALTVQYVPSLPEPTKQLEDFFLFTLCPESAEHFDPHRVIEHSLPKNFEMLLSEHGRWREHRDLASIHHGFEGRADCDFGLAEADIAADQAVHRARTFHVNLGVDDRFHLVGRFAKRERMFEFQLPFCVRPERMAGNRFALRLNR